MPPGPRRILVVFNIQEFRSEQSQNIAFTKEDLYGVLRDSGTRSLVKALMRKSEVESTRDTSAVEKCHVFSNYKKSKLGSFSNGAWPPPPARETACKGTDIYFRQSDVVHAPVPSG